MCSKLLCFTIFVTIVSTARGERYDYFYSKHAKGWLKLHHEGANFTDAFLRCDREGAVLASPSDDGLQKALQLLFLKMNIPCAIYTGIHKSFSHEDYTIIEGTPLSSLPVKWASYSYEDGENLDCVVMLSNGTLVQESCNENHPYACYKKKVNPPGVNECGTIYRGYKFDKRTGSCYKHNKTNTSWRRAFSSCLTEGAYLAIINSDTEAEVIKEMTRSGQAMIGYLDWNSQGLWYTIHGQKLQDAGFSRWGNNQPDNYKIINPLGEHCGAAGSELNDISCDHVYQSVGFICEKDPESLSVAEECSSVACQNVATASRHSIQACKNSCHVNSHPFQNYVPAVWE